jgi:hypothetical protein
MIRLLCRDRHGSREALCPSCADLAAYARLRLEKCPFKSDKPTCAKCSVHCYRARADERERMREVMRHAGPRMMVRHPVLALRHLLDSRRKGRAHLRSKGSKASSTDTDEPREW